MNAHLLIAIASCAAAGTLHAQEPTPGVIRSSAPPPRPHPVVTTPAAVPSVAAPQRPPTSFAPGVNGPHGLGVGNGVYRPLPNYTARQFQPGISQRGPARAYGTTPANRSWNRPTNTGTTGVTPRVGSVPQQNTAVTSGTRTWNRGGTANTNVATGTSNGTNTTRNDWRTRSPNNYANWQDARRHYDHQRHDRDWWRRHHDRIIFVNNGYYFWDAGWWYPAWGYDPAAEYYAYDGPIYGYDGLPPDQVIGQVQSALQQQGYYRGAIDGQLGPMTQQALADWQRDHGLAITTAIDYPTLASLGLT